MPCKLQVKHPCASKALLKLVKRSRKRDHTSGLPPLQATMLFLKVLEILATESFEKTQASYENKGLPKCQEVETLQQNAGFMSEN